MTSAPRTGAWGGRGARALVGLVLEHYGPRCHLCQLPITATTGPDRPSADHLVPRSAGGTNDLANLRPAHLSCNMRRGAKPLTAELLAQLRRRPAETGAGFFRR